MLTKYSTEWFFMGRLVQIDEYYEKPKILKVFGLAFLLISAVFLLASCGSSTKRAFGLERMSPDEFSVIKRAPLSQPPDYKLRPPRPGAERPGVASPREQARRVVFLGKDDRNKKSNTLNINKGTTKGESAFLKRAGARKVEPNIRNKVDQESSVLVDANQTFVEKLLGFAKDNAEIVDAEAETKRLQQNKKLGQKPTKGKPPFIDRKKNQLFKF